MTQRWVLWGSHPLYANGAPIRLEVGNLRECRAELQYRTKDARWSLWYRKSGEGSGDAT